MESVVRHTSHTHRALPIAYMMSRQKHIPWWIWSGTPHWGTWFGEQKSEGFTSVPTCNLQPIQRGTTLHIQTAVITLGENAPCSLLSLCPLCSAAFLPLFRMYFLFIARKSVRRCPNLSSLQILPPQGPQKQPCRKVPADV